MPMPQASTAPIHANPIPMQRPAAVAAVMAKPSAPFRIRLLPTLIGMTGLNPLRGPNLEQFGPRFPDMSEAYDPALQRLAREVAREYGILLREGVYTGLAGPSFETPAELCFLRSIGSDAVGMSTVAETTVARHGGMRVLGLSGISNIVVYEPSQGQGASHEEVLEAGKQIVPKLIAVIKGTLQRLAQLD